MTINQAFSLLRAATVKPSLALIALTMTFSSAAQAGQDNRIAQYVYSGSKQIGPGNYSVIYQNGNNNRTNVAQSYSAQYQNGNFSSIRQIGNANAASIEQIGGNNTSQVSQKGNEHSVSILQNNGSQGAEAFVTQTGQQSNITISQSGSGYRSINVEQQAFSGNARPVTVVTY
ncbi:hypothetical protein ACGLWX_10345 [Halomonas sp. HMF6819]|uniref:hypothetical protein n=1 Tax=unclassified Halomonas TaxID=2609666 RepID=UPI0020768368|nr:MULTISPECIES: hypothetical protein [unclassified Halomonas]